MFAMPQGVSEWTFPLPQQSVTESGSRSSSNLLGFRKHGGPIGDPIGVQRILDELAIKRFADELFVVAIDLIVTISSSTLRVWWVLCTPAGRHTPATQED